MKGKIRVELGSGNVKLEGELKRKNEVFQGTRLPKMENWVNPHQGDTWIFNRQGRGPHHAPLIPLKILSWNCRGLGKTDTVNFLRCLVKFHCPNCDFLIETKCGAEQMERVARMLGFNNFEIVEARGTAGGLILMWTDDVNIEMEWKSDRIIGCDILDYDRVKRWSIFACHGTPYNSEKRTFWEDFEEVIKNIINHWLIIGDLNEVVSQEEKWGAKSVWRKELYLKEFMSTVG